MFAIVVLRKNNNGNYFADIIINGRRIKAYLSQRVIESGRLFSQVGENLKYLAFIQKDQNKDTAFINQILQIPTDIEIGEWSNFEFIGNCHLISNGGVDFKLQKQDVTWHLPYSSIKDFIYKIFNNSLVKINLSLNNKIGFVIRNITVIYPKIQSGMLGYALSINKQENKKYYSAKFYIDDCNDKNIFLPVRLPDQTIRQSGIFEISADAKVRTHLTFDHDNNKHNIEIIHNPENSVRAYNVPQAMLYFVEFDKKLNKYIFKTKMKNGISLLVSLWDSDLSYYYDEPKNIQSDSTISCKLDFNENKGWINYGIPRPKKDRYEGLFTCYRSSVINGRNYLWFEYTNSPYFRFRISQESFYNHGVYNILVGASVKLEIEKKDPENAREWVIKNIDEAINPLSLGFPIPMSATVISTWVKHDNSPNYITKVDRSIKSYALKNHCIAKVQVKNTELLVIIPKQLLVQKGFYRVQTDEVLDLEVFTVTYPVFDVSPIKILCANKVKSEPTASYDQSDGKVLTVEFVQVMGMQEKGYMKYEFRVVDNNEVIYYNDRKDILKKIKSIGNYQFIIRSSEYNGNLYIKELISAKLNPSLK